jgi:hypothetical protein
MRKAANIWTHDALAFAALIVTALIGFQQMAYAGQCGEEIAELEKLARTSKSHPTVGPTERQTTGAQLHRQPTPESVAAAKEKAWAKVDAVLERAKTFDAEGKEAECRASAGEAKQLLGIE